MCRWQGEGGESVCKNYTEANDLCNDIYSLAEDREGNLWAGTGTGLNMLRPSNVMVVSPPDHWQGRAVLSVTTSSPSSVQ